MDVQALISTDWQALFLPLLITISFSTCLLLSLTCPLDSSLWLRMDMWTWSAAEDRDTLSPAVMKD